MNSIIRNIFGKKTQNNNISPFKPLDNKTAEKPSEKKKESFAPKSMKKVMRGPDGKFMSKKKPAKKEVQPEQAPAVIEPASKNKENKQVTPNYQISTFYSKNIRRIYKDNTWYFSLEDMLHVAAVDDPESFLEKPKGKPSIKKAFDNAVIRINLSDQNGAKMVGCVTYEGFMALLPIIRESGHMFPGPFPDWLRDISELPSTP